VPGVRATRINTWPLQSIAGTLAVLAVGTVGLVATAAYAHGLDRSGTVSVRIAGPADNETFSATLDRRPLPETIAQATRRFGRPSHKHRYGPAGVDCALSWPREHVSGTFTVALSGIRNGCDPGAGTIEITLGRGWRTNRGLAVGDSIAQLRLDYPNASESAHGWALVRYFYGAGFEVTELGAETKGGAVTGLTVAGIPDE
jgi:hypothetical protein